MTTSEQVRRILAPIALAPLPADDDASLLDLGILDSFGLLAVVRALETSFGIRIPESEVVPRRLETIARIARLVDARR